MTSQSEIQMVVLSATRQLYRQYPQCEWDDLVAQSWLIVTEEIDKWDAEKSSFKTYLHRIITFRLSDYIRRYVIKEDTMGGSRDFGEWHDAEVGDTTAQIEARNQLEVIRKTLSGVSRDIFDFYMAGYTQTEIADIMGCSRQNVSKVITKIREEHKDVA